jgi:AcrR family transcriptional regulator
VLEATLAELVEADFADVRIEQIAARAGVAPSTVYRRWGDLQGIINDLSSELTVSIDLQDTGDLELDLRVVARAVVALRQIPAHRAWLDAMVAEAVRSPQARQTLATAIERRREITAEIVHRAVARGEVPADTDAHEVIRLTVAPLYLRMYITNEPLDGKVADRAAAVAADAARHGLLRLSGAE